MASTLTNIYRLSKAGLVMARHGVRFVPRNMKVPLALRFAQWATFPITVLTWPLRAGRPRNQRISDALARLGPSYIKLGQFLATRADVIGPKLASELSFLQDKLPPFSDTESRRAIEDAFGAKREDLYVEFGPPVAAASIAQVHQAVTDTAGERRQMAVKVLRPGVEKRFKADLDSYYFVARQIEKWHPPSRRLRPMAVVDTLKQTTELEMDLRLEAAAISEMAENITEDEGFRVPEIDWRRTSKRVMTIEWIDGIKMSDIEGLKAAGFDLPQLGLTVIQSFLRHAMRDGFFHADMHPGNLFVDRDGIIVAVDFGIMGRLGKNEQRFLAEILHGLVTRDYRRAAAIHFEAGYVPPHHSIDTFAQAMRAIGEPIHGRTASEISMADLLGQLFAYTEVFDMQTRPELIMLQKSMVIVEGVARSLNPNLNMWSAAEPVAKEWIENNMGVAGRLRGAGEGAEEIGRVLSHLPELMSEAQQTSRAINDMTRSGVPLDEKTVTLLARARSRGAWISGAALWVGAAALVTMAYLQWAG